jgi:magnesium transporter
MDTGGLKRTTAVAWRDMAVRAHTQWQEIGHSLKLHERQQKALAHGLYRPHAVEDDRGLLLNFVVPVQHGQTIKFERLAVLVTQKEVVTIHHEKFQFLQEISDRVAVSSERKSSPSGVLSIIVDVVTEQFGPIIDYVDASIDQLEDVMIDNPTKEQLHSLFTLKQMLVSLRRIVTPTATMLNGLIDGRYALIDKKFIPYLRDSYDYTWRTHELIDTLRDLLSSSLDTYLSVVSNRLNEVMKRLTIIATIFLPLSFIVGLGGINFKQFPFQQDLAYVVLMISLVVMPIAMIIYFRVKKWL